MKSNRTFSRFSVRFVAKTPFLNVAFFLFCAVCAFSVAASGVEPLVFDASRWPDDGFPLLERRDKAPLDEIWNALENSGNLVPFANAVDLQLRRQGASYRGKPLTVRGRLLRGVFVPDSNGSGSGRFDLWILLPDSKRDPVRLLTRRAPENFVPDEKIENAAPYPEDVEYRRETIETLAVYYRTTAFNAGDDFFAAPTLVALDFRLTPEKTARTAENPADSSATSADSTSRSDWIGVKIGVLCGLVAGWLAVRRIAARRGGPGNRKKAKKTLRNSDLPDSIEPFFIAALAAGTLLAPAFAAPISADEPPISASETAKTALHEDADEFWADAIGKPLEIWNRETTETRPRIFGDATDETVAERREIALLVFDRLARLASPVVLTERFGAAPLGDFVAAAPEKRVPSPPNAPIRPFCGTLLSVETLPLNETEERRFGVPAIFRVVVKLDPARNAAGAPRKIALYSPNLPQFDAPPAFFDGSASQNPIVSPERLAERERGIGERVAFLGVPFGFETVESPKNAPEGAPIPTALTPRLGWFPTDSPLGRRGVDLSTFEAVPVFPTNALSSAKTPAEKRAAARALRWTLDDRAPFYESLAAVRRRPGGIAEPADALKKNADVVVPTDAEIAVALFNRPEENQGRPVRLRGRVRRANLIVVDDADVRAATGLDRYWQLYLFSNESQGWPFVLCVPELPDGMEPGGGADYRVEIDFSGFFYKTWAYKTSQPPERIADATEIDAESAAFSNAPSSWARVPLLIGRVAKIYPEEPAASAPFSPGALFGAFAVLAALWIALRRSSKRRPVR